MGYLHFFILIKKYNNYEVNFEIKIKLMLYDNKFFDLYDFSNIPLNIINIVHY